MNEEEVVGGVLGQDPDPNNIFAHDMMDHDDHDGAAVEAFQVSESLITALVDILPIFWIYSMVQQSAILFSTNLSQPQK